MLKFHSTKVRITGDQPSKYLGTDRGLLPARASEGVVCIVEFPYPGIGVLKPAITHCTLLLQEYSGIIHSMISLIKDITIPRGM
jgi:hypothetical protein